MNVKMNKRLAAGILAGIIGISGYGYAKSDYRKVAKLEKELDAQYLIEMELKEHAEENAKKKSSEEISEIATALYNLKSLDAVSFIAGADIAAYDKIMGKEYNPKSNEYYQKYQDYMNEEKYFEGYRFGHENEFFVKELKSIAPEEIKHVIENTLAVFECIDNGSVAVNDGEFDILDSQKVSKTVFEIYTNSSSNDEEKIKVISKYLGNTISIRDLITEKGYSPKDNESYEKYKDYLDEKSYKEGYDVPYSEISLYTFRFEENLEDIQNGIDYACDVLDTVIKDNNYAANTKTKTR